MYRHQLGQNEWKVILPKRVYAFHIVDLSDYQYCSSVLMFNIFAAVFNKAPALSEFSVFTSDRLTVPLTWSQWESVKSASERWCEHFAQEKKVDELRPVTKEVIQISKIICDFHLCSKWINKIFFFLFKSVAFLMATKTSLSLESYGNVMFWTCSGLIPVHPSIHPIPGSIWGFFKFWLFKHNFLW